MISNYWSWKSIIDWFEFFLILAALCGCGYIVWRQLVYLYLMLFLGGIAAGLAPVVSSLYIMPMPRKWIGLTPSLDKLYAISREKLEELDYIEEAELQNVIKSFNKAKEILATYTENHPNAINRYPNIIEIYQLINIAQQRSKEIYQVIVHQHQVYEQQEEQRLKKLRKDDGLRLIGREFKHGKPPVDEYTCPPDCPIKATTHQKDGKYKGIYYQPGTYDQRVQWCFESDEHAKADKFRLKRKQGRKKNKS